MLVDEFLCPECGEPCDPETEFNEETGMCVYCEEQAQADQDMRDIEFDDSLEDMDHDND